MALLGDAERTREEIGKISAQDARGFENYIDDLGLVHDMYRETVISEKIPSRGEFRDRVNEKHPGLGSLFVDGNLQEALARYFSDPAVQAAFGGTAFLYNCAPDEPGTAFALIYLAQFSAGGEPGWAFYPGGMGCLMEKMAARLVETGNAIHFGKKITSIEIRNNKAVAVKCGNDVYDGFDLVVSGYPFEKLELNDAAAQKPLIADGMCSKINLLLKQPIEFDLADASHAREAQKSMFVFCPSLDYMSEAHRSAQKRGYSENPYFEIVQPSAMDASLSCGVHHLASVYCMFSLYSLFAHDRQRRSQWQAHLEGVFRSNGVRMPEISASEFLDPFDLEQKFGLMKGNVDHGNLSPGNSFSGRTIVRGRPYETPCENVYLCGSSQFPGGLVTGIPGRRAAELILSRVSF
jgi:phytoene dehydrogenase-like protein